MPAPAGNRNEVQMIEKMGFKGAEGCASTSLVKEGDLHLEMAGREREGREVAGHIEQVDTRSLDDVRKLGPATTEE